MEKKEIINRIEYFRKSKEMNIKDFLSNTQLTQDKYSKIKNSKRHLQMEDIILITAKHHINLNWLIHGAGEMDLIDNNNETEVKKLTRYANKKFNDSDYVEKIIKNQILVDIVERLNFNKNWIRPLFLLRKVLKNISTTVHDTFKSQLINEIKNTKDIFLSTNESLVYKIETLSEDDCIFMLKNKEQVVKILESKNYPIEVKFRDFKLKEKISKWF